jgi:CAAX prenyl protease-like protein
MQESFGEAGRYWIYAGKSFAGVWLIYEMWPFVKEIRWNFSWEAVVVGIGVCVMWVGIDSFYPKMSAAGTPWNPHKQFGEGSSVAWFLIVVRTLGSTLVVPPLEEAFYRSFLYRYLVRNDFMSLPFSRLHWLSMVVTALVFGFVHYQWLAGILCAMAYQWLCIRKNRLGDAITAHAITNFLLALWVVLRNDYRFW